MSQVIWVNSRIGENVTGDASDKPCILKFADKLDSLCPGERKFSGFVDYTDARATASGDYQGYDDGWELLRHKGAWFDPAEGLALLEKLIEIIERDRPRFGLLSNKAAEVLSELRECAAALETIKAAGGKFHFGVVA